MTTRKSGCASGVELVLRKLRAGARRGNVSGMARFGIRTAGRLGVPVPVMRRIARETGRDHPLALALWRTGMPEARILASMIADPDMLTGRQMEQWARGFDSWDVCDQVCMNLFRRSPLARGKIVEWSSRGEEFVKRAAFAMIACLAVHDKSAADSEFERLTPVIKNGSADGRTYVKKAVSWALRSIGKRSPALRRAALAAAVDIRRLDSGAARWIAADATRELEG